MNNEVLPSSKLHNGETNPLQLSKYHAGYSPHFVKKALAFLNAQRGDTIVDPWCGAGTTGWTSQIYGLNSYLIDLNPVCAIFSAASDLWLSTSGMVKVIRNLEKELINSLKSEKIDKKRNLPIWCPPNFTNYTIWVLNSIGRTNLELDRKLISSVHAFLVVAIFNIYKNFIDFYRTTNPTYYKLEKKYYRDINKNDFLVLFKLEVERLLNNLKIFSQNSFSQKILVYNRSSVEPVFEENCADWIITSPPYCTRIDYSRVTFIELKLLELANFLNFDTIRKNLIGTTTVDHQKGVSSDQWGYQCNDLLIKIKNHKSYGSRHYYYYNFCQYFFDIFQSFLQIRKYLRKHGKGLIVVQNSYYKELEIDLGEIFIEMLANIEMEGEIIKTETLSRSKTTKKERIYREKMLLIKHK